MNALLNVPQADVRAWELATNVPELQNLWAYVCLALNVIIPGTGTMICACLGDENMNKTQLFIGFFQFLTSIYLIGWIFSIFVGNLNFHLATKTRKLLGLPDVLCCTERVRLIKS